LILMDLGSAVMTTQMVLEMLPPEHQAHVRLSNAPWWRAPSPQPCPLPWAMTWTGYSMPPRPR
jgi:hypothetical protein